MALFKNLLWIILVTGLIYYNLIVLTDQIIAGNI